MAMSLTEYTKRLSNIADNVGTQEVRDEAYIRAGNALLGNIKNRIQREGKDSSGKEMPPYSTAAAYFQRSEFVRKSSFKAVGKNGFKGQKIQRSKNYSVSTIKSGKNKGKERLIRDRDYEVVKTSPPKTMYFENGYKGFKDAQGMETSVRTLNYSGDMMLSYVLGTGNDAIILGFNQDKQSKKRKWVEEKNGGKIFSGTEQEFNEFNANIIQNEREIINRIFTS